MSTPFIVQPARRIMGQAQVPGDKSISHRAALLGALAQGETRIGGFLQAQDCLATLRCLEAMGVQIQPSASERSGSDDLVVLGQGLYGLHKPPGPLDCGGSGTTMRLIAGILAGQPFASTLTGNDALRRRPMDRIVEPLQRMGAHITGSDEGRLPPLQIEGGPLHGMVYHLPMASAQVKSAILLAGLYAKQPTVIHEPGPARDHTERMLSAMGVQIEINDSVIAMTAPLAKGQELQPLDIQVPGDFSSAAFLMVAACIVPESKLRLQGVNTNPTRTGLLDVLLKMGARIALENQRVLGGEPMADLVIESGPLHGGVVEGSLVPRMIDEFPILAVAATQAHGQTVIRDAAELRVKESDRIASVSQELARMGAHIEEHPDGFTITGPTPLHGALLDSHRDHRLAMSLAVAGLIARGETAIQGAESIDDSFPGFQALLSSICERSAPHA